MKKLLPNLVILLALSVSPVGAEAQNVPDSRVADLVDAGKLRVALFLPQYYEDPATGKVGRLATVGDLTVQLARALAGRLGLEVVVLGFPTPPATVECLKARACDVALMGPDETRDADIDFSHAIIEIDYTYLVPPGSSIRSGAEADRPGVRIAAVRDHASTLTLSRMLKRAELITEPTPEATFALLSSGRAHALVSVRTALQYYYAPQLPGSRVLEDHYGSNLLAFALPKGQLGRLAYFNEFIEEVKKSGFVQEAIARLGRQGIIKVAPAAGTTAQK
jgi:polar amino acid transport system substrate-binding protein